MGDCRDLLCHQHRCGSVVDRKSRTNGQHTRSVSPTSWRPKTKP
jgi:hypothetical protein